MITKRQILMDAKQRHKRLRLLIRKLNKERKRQAQKIDILCNDLIAAQREFIKRLDTISFTADFYEAIVGISDLRALLYTASKLIKDEIANANVSFFLRQQGSFELHMFEGSPHYFGFAKQNSGATYCKKGPLESEQAGTAEQQHLESCFSPELVENICRSNKVCRLEDMFAMGLQGNLMSLNKLSVVTIPLGQLGSSLGFILLYRSSQNELTADELNNICAVSRGLALAIQSCRLPLHSVD